MIVRVRVLSVHGVKLGEGRRIMRLLGNGSCIEDELRLASSAGRQKNGVSLAPMRGGRAVVVGVFIAAGVFVVWARSLRHACFWLGNVLLIVLQVC